MSTQANRAYSMAPEGAAARGVVWSVAQNGSKHLLNLAVFLCLARLLDPQAYGLVALVAGVLTFAAVMIEQGMGDAIVQRPTLEPEHLDSAFAFNAGAGVLIGAAVFAAADLAGALFDQPAVAEVMRAMAVIPLLQALAVVPQALMTRQLSFGVLALRTLAGVAAGGAAGIAVALQGHGVYALVAQQLVGALVSAAVLWLRCDWRPGLRWSGRHLGELHRFGRNILGAQLLDVVNRKSDDLIIGFFLGPVALGVYSVAYQLLVVLEQFLCKGFDALSLAAFSRACGDRTQLSEGLGQASRLTAVVAFPVALGAASVAPDAVALLFGAQWAPSADVFRILAVVACVHAVMHYNHAVFKACGKPGISVRLAMLEAAVNVPVFLLAVRYGIAAVALAYTLRAFALAPACLAQSRRLIGLDVARYLRGLAPPAFASAAMVLLVVAVASFAPVSWPPAARLAASVALGVLAYPLVLRVVAPALFFSTRGLLREALGAFRGARAVTRKHSDA